MAEGLERRPTISSFILLFATFEAVRPDVTRVAPELRVVCFRLVAGVFLGGGF